jgi:hypothetical protein
MIYVSFIIIVLKVSEKKVGGITLVPPLVDQMLNRNMLISL